MARCNRSRLYLCKTTGQSPKMRFQTEATVSPIAVSETCGKFTGGKNRAANEADQMDQFIQACPSLVH